MNSAAKMPDSSPSRAALRLPQIVALYVGAVLGSGILILPGVAAEISGPASLLAWGLMSVLTLPLALTMGWLSAAYPNDGGVSHFVAKAFNPLLGSLIGWYFAMAVVVGAPVIALTGSGYFCAALGLNDNFRLLISIAILFLGLVTDYFGMKLTGRLQIAVVLTTLTVLACTIATGLFDIAPGNFSPFMPKGWVSVGSSATVLFWCFIGWEAVSNMSAEFRDPRRDAIRGTVIAAMVVSVIYFLTALVIVGTHSYGPDISDTALVHVIRHSFGRSGAIVAGTAALFVCAAPAIAYTGAISRQILALSQSGYAPKALSLVSAKYKTPLGGIGFLAVCFLILLAIFSTRIATMATLIQLPSAAFILTYCGGCAAGVRLLKGNRWGFLLSVISLILSLAILLFVTWTALYVAAITFFWFCYVLTSNNVHWRRGNS